MTEQREILKKRQVRQRRTRVTRHALAHALLGTLLVAGTALFITAPGLSDALARLPNGRRNAHRVPQLIENLYRRGLVTLTGSKGARMAALTDRGRAMAYFNALAVPTTSKAQWDETWFMVSFDIPVAHRKAHDALRHALTRLGFKKLQKSLYLYPVGCESEIDFLSAYFGVSAYVTYFYAASLSEDARFRKQFKL